MGADGRVIDVPGPYLGRVGGERSVPDAEAIVSQIAEFIRYDLKYVDRSKPMPPDFWSVNATERGVWCARKGTVLLWRPDIESDTRVAVRGDGARYSGTWKGGSETFELPEEITGDRVSR